MMEKFKKRLISCGKFIRYNGFSAFINYIFFLAFKKLEQFVCYISYIFLDKVKENAENSSASFFELISKNKTLKQKHMGESVFVLATGPSVKAVVPFLNLESKIIVVNETYYLLKEKNIIPHYLILNDEAYFIMDKYKNLLKEILGASTNAEMILLFPLNQKARIDKLVEENGYNPKTYYYHTYLSLIRFSRRMDVDVFDFSRALPGLPTVTHVAVCFSIFLGFSKVYLGGVDMDYVCNPTQPIKHGYDALLTDRSELNLSCLQEYQDSMNWDYQDLLRNTLEQIKCYEIIERISQRKNIKIFNLSKKSVLQVFPYLELSSL